VFSSLAFAARLLSNSVNADQLAAGLKLVWFGIAAE
jgi:hypothetical protein